MDKVLEIVIFSNEFTTIADWETKIQTVVGAFEDYAFVNGGRVIHGPRVTGSFTGSSEIDYEVRSIHFDGIPCIISLACKNPITSHSTEIESGFEDDFEYMVAPRIYFSVSMQRTFFEQKIIQDLLNNTVRFFSGTFPKQYFVDVDSTYLLERMNEGKKYQESDLARYTLDPKNMQENSHMLDAALYLRYTLKKNIFLLESYATENQTHQSDVSLNAGVQLTQERSAVTKNTLVVHLGEFDQRIKAMLATFATWKSMQ